MDFKTSLVALSLFLPGVVSSAACTAFITAQQGDTCASIATSARITVTQLLRNNPTITSCENLPRGEAYCVDIPQAPFPPTTTSTNPSSAVPTLRTTQDGQCGGDLTCQGSTFGQCCSPHFWCGSTLEHCGDGCNAAFGLCSDQGTSILSSSTTSNNRTNGSTSILPPSGCPTDNNTTIRLTLTETARATATILLTSIIDAEPSTITKATTATATVTTTAIRTTAVPATTRTICTETVSKTATATKTLTLTTETSEIICTETTTRRRRSTVTETVTAEGDTVTVTVTRTRRRCRTGDGEPTDDVL